MIKVSIKKASSKKAITSTLLAEVMPFDSILNILSELSNITPITKRSAPPIIDDPTPPCFCASSMNNHLIAQMIKITPATLRNGIKRVKKDSIRPPAWSNGISALPVDIPASTYFD